MGTHLRVLSESYPIYTNMTGFKWFSKKSLRPCVLDESSVIVRRVMIIQLIMLEETEENLTTYYTKSLSTTISPALRRIPSQPVVGDNEQSMVTPSNTQLSGQAPESVQQ